MAETKIMKTVNLTAALVDASSVRDSEKQKQALDAMVELERRYKDLEEAQRNQIQLERMAMAARAEADMAKNGLDLKRNQFLHFAGQHIKDVGEWSYWPLPPRKDESGNIILETPISQNEVRKSAQALNTLVNQNSEAIISQSQKTDRERSDFSGMFGDDSPEQ